MLISVWAAPYGAPPAYHPMLTSVVDAVHAESMGLLMRYPANLPPLLWLRVLRPMETADGAAMDPSELSLPEVSLPEGGSTCSLWVPDKGAREQAFREHAGACREHDGSMKGA